MDDSELLAEFGRERSGSAFGEIVRRYTDLVYSAALRQMRNADEAEELTQAVFVILSQKAGSISPNVPLAGWLLTTTRFAAMNLRRAKFRRAHHERKAAVTEQQPEQSQPDDAWKEIAPMLDAAMASLKSDQRNAVALRYFQGQPFSAVASRMGISEEAAKKRVTRGVEKLRTFFARRGVAVPVVGITATITSHAVQAAPVHLATSCAVASKGSAVLGGELLRYMVMGKIKVIASAVLATVALGGATVVTVHVIHGRAQSAIPAVAKAAIPPKVVAIAQAPGISVHGTVIGTDGKPVAGIKVYNASRAHPVLIYPSPDGQRNAPVLSIVPDAGVSQVLHLGIPNLPAPSATTDQNGQFDLKVAPMVKSMLVVYDDRGFAAMRIQDFKNGNAIQLKAWAHIEGTIDLKDRSIIGSQIYLAKWQDFQNPYADELIVSCSVPIDGDGHFEIPQVPPGAVWLYTKLTTDMRQDFFGPSTFVQAVAGQTMKAVIGENGHTIKGRFVPPAGSDPITGWHDARHWSECLLRNALPNAMPFVNYWEAMNPLVRSSYRDDWQETPAAKSWNESILPQCPVIQPDGSFQIVGVKPGQYILEMHAEDVDPTYRYDDEAASLVKQVIVPADGNQQLLDLGDVTVQMNPLLHLKKPAPVLTAASLAAGGAPIHLSDYKGKYVLLHVWSAANPNPDQTRPVDMFALNEDFGSNSKLVLLGINHDSNLDSARAFVTTNRLDHWTMTSGSGFDGLPDEYKNIAGGAVLIGPDGNVIAKHLFGDHIDSLLRRELGN